jgi:acyl-coenzyme A synthetase/AMP-(fatty) acid ligase
MSEYLQIPERINIAACTLDRNVEEGGGDRIALYFDGRTYTYRELQRLVNACGNALRGIGIGKGDHFLIRSRNCPDYVIAALAGMKIGAVPVPTNSLFRMWELEHIVRNSEAKAVMSSVDLLDAIVEVQGRCPSLQHVIVFGNSPARGYSCFEDFIRGASDELEGADTASDDPSFAIYTSGTTGQPKGVEHAHRWIVATGEPISKTLMRLTPEDICFSPLEVSFIYAFGCNLLYPLLAGAAVAMMPGRFDPELTLAAIDRLKPTIFIAVPTLFRRVLASGEVTRKYDLRSVRMGMSSGEPLPIDTLRQARERLGIEIYDCLGQTEIHIFMNPDPARKLGSLGKPLPGHVVTLLTDEGREAGIGEVGHLVIRSDDPGLCLGYRRTPELWQACHRNGWYYTKDLAFKDEDGFFWYVSRSDDLIKSRAYLISPREVESAIMEHPAVLEAGVIGVPDELIGQRVAAYVTLQQGHEASDGLAVEILSHVRAKIAAFKAPKDLFFADSLPRTATGKLIRQELRKKAEQSNTTVP